MIAFSENCGFGIPHGLRTRRLLLSAAVALGTLLMAVPGFGPTPAAAQTFSFGGFRIHVSGLGISGGHYYRHHSSRHYANTSNSRRHGRRHGREREDETAVSTSTPEPQTLPAAPVASSSPIEARVNRPVLEGPDFEPSK